LLDFRRQWFRYTVNVGTAGTYNVSMRVAAPAAVTDALHLANATGTNLSGNVNFPATGGWQTWTTVTAQVTLPAGQQVLTLNEDNGGWNINSLQFAATTAEPPPWRRTDLADLRQPGRDHDQRAAGGDGDQHRHGGGVGLLGGDLGRLQPDQHLRKLARGERLVHSQRQLHPTASGTRTGSLTVTAQRPTARPPWP